MLALLVIAGARPAEQQEIRIESHTHDSIVCDEKITVHGSVVGIADGEEVELFVKGVLHGTKAKVKDGKWKFTDVDVPPREAVWVVSCKKAGKQHTILLTKVVGVQQMGRRQVYFRWPPSAKRLVAEIANKTLNVPPNGKSLDGFVARVMATAEEVCASAFAGIDVDVIQEPENPKATDLAVNMTHKTSSGTYGQSYPVLNSCDVLVGSYYIDTLEAKLADWAPMSKSDTPEVREEDLGQALGRTAAHEVGHLLGLVGYDGKHPWMRGCGGHTCKNPLFAEHPLTKRWDRGWFLMDPGPETENRARLGEYVEDLPPALRDKRVQSRRPPRFNDFNRAYLLLVCPR
jgi:hypothetical protein